MMKTHLLSVIALIAVLSPPAAAQTPAPRAAGAPKELRVGIVTLLSGPASSTFGIPAKKAADAWVEKINDEGGIGGGESVAGVHADAGPRGKDVARVCRLARVGEGGLRIGDCISASGYDVQARPDE